MHNKIVIRNEREADYKTVEAVTRKAFWNLYIPGCNEHYLVNIMRNHADFVSELDFVIELDGQIIGNIMYTKAWLTEAGDGKEKEILTFGPVSILPEHQRRGYGKQLIEHSMARAAELGYEAIVIFGCPGNYVGRGFISSHKHNISICDGSYPTAMMVKELKPGALSGKKWVYRDSPVMNIDEAAAERFDGQFERMEKKVTPSQEEFYIYSHSRISVEK